MWPPGQRSGRRRARLSARSQRGIVVVGYDNGAPMVVRGMKNGHNRVDLAMFPGGCSGSYWAGDGFELIRNAVEF